MAVVSVPNPSSVKGTRDLSDQIILAPKQGDYIPLNPGEEFADVRLTLNPSLAHSIAFWFEARGTPGSMNVLDKIPSEAFVWHKIPEGQHRIHAVLWKATAAMDASSRPKTLEDLEGFECLGRESIDIYVRRFEDFQPTYDWQPFERWHQLPPGLEISVDTRRARIPEPWPWNVEVVGQGTEQIQVHGTSTMSQLLELLKLSDSTHEVVWRDAKHEYTLQPAWTARQADLFRYREHVVVRRFATIVD